MLTEKLAGETYLFDDTRSLASIAKASIPKFNHGNKKNFGNQDASYTLAIPNLRENTERGFYGHVLELRQ